jgi:hypothetical protein
MSGLAINPEISVAKKVKQQIHNLPQEESQVIIHINLHPCNPICLSSNSCRFEVSAEISLIPNTNASASRLVHAININVSPATIAITKEVTSFSLVFNGLPKLATSFDFIEPGNKGWKLLNIPRNISDVYVLNIHKLEITLVG